MNPPPRPPPPRPKEGLPGVAIAAIVVACLGLLAVGGLVVIGAVMGYRDAAKRSAEAKVDPHTVALTERHATQNGLLTAHYPADFATKSLDDATLLVSRVFSSGEDEGLALAAVKNPITDDASEFARLLWTQAQKSITAKGGEATKSYERKATCLDKYPGVEVEWSFSLPQTRPYVSRGCFFIHDNRGYELRYFVPKARATDDIPLLDRIIAASELAP
jgi:hypothetical protein